MKRSYYDPRATITRASDVKPDRLGIAIVLFSLAYYGMLVLVIAAFAAQGDSYGLD